MTEPELARPRSLTAPLIVVGLLILVGVVYAQMASARFITLDDSVYTYGEPRIINGLTPGNIFWAFTKIYQGFYIPLTWLSLQLDATLFGKDPMGYHLHNVVLFMANVVLVYCIFRKCVRSAWQAALPATIWALHPMRVESVAWITERKDVLAGVFGFTAILLYLSGITTKRWKTILLVTIFFALTLLSKPMFVTLPALLLILDIYPLKRMTSLRVVLGLVLEKAPLFLGSLISSAITARAHVGRNIILDVPWDLRLSNVVVSYVRYLGKFCYPKLGIYYALPSSPWPASYVIPAVGVLLLLLILAFMLRRKMPALLAGLLFFLIAPLPNIGIIQAFTQAMADRYSYLSSFGLALIFTGLVSLATRGWARGVLITITALLGLGLSTLSYRQASHWHTPIMLYEHSITVEESAFLHDILAKAYFDRFRDLMSDSLNRDEDQAKAIYHFNRAIEMDPVKYGVDKEYVDMLNAP